MKELQKTPSVLHTVDYLQEYPNLSLKPIEATNSLLGVLIYSDLFCDSKVETSLRFKRRDAYL